MKNDAKENLKKSVEEQEELCEIWSKKMALEGLKEVMAVSIEAAKQTTDSKFNSSAANAATKAIDIANKMLGYGACADEEDEITEVIVSFEDGEEFSE